VRFWQRASHESRDLVVDHVWPSQTGEHQTVFASTPL
jgi:hypothetical protein